MDKVVLAIIIMTTTMPLRKRVVRGFCRSADRQQSCGLRLAFYCQVLADKINVQTPS